MVSHVRLALRPSSTCAFGFPSVRKSKLKSKGVLRVLPWRYALNEHNPHQNMGTAVLRGVVITAILALMAVGSCVARAEDCGEDCQTRVLAGAAGGAAAKTGTDLTAVAEGGAFRTHEGSVYTGTRKGSGSTYSAGDTDVGSTTRDPAIRGREKGTEIRTTHHIKSADPADLTRVELAVQQRLQNTSRLAVPPGGAVPSTPRVDGAADEIVEAIRRGAASTVHDLRTASEKVLTECTARPKSCASLGRALTAGGVMVIGAAALVPDPTDMVLVPWCDSGTVKCADGTAQCRNVGCNQNGGNR